MLVLAKTPRLNPTLRLSPLRNTQSPIISGPLRKAPIVQSQVEVAIDSVAVLFCTVGTLNITIFH